MEWLIAVGSITSLHFSNTDLNIPIAANIPLLLAL